MDNTEVTKRNNIHNTEDKTELQITPTDNIKACNLH